VKSKPLFVYQALTGLSDTGTGWLLCVAPLATLRLLGIDVPREAAPYISYIGAFVLSVGLACLYGLLLLMMAPSSERLETVWLLTAFTRSAVALFIAKSVITGQLPPEWLMVAFFDGGCAAIQAVGLRQRWLRDAD
jgi:hypothetical protein